MLRRLAPLAAGLLCLPFLLSLPALAQTLDEMLVSGKLPDEARFAPGELTLGPVLSGALEEVSAETLALMKFGNPCLRVVMGLSQFAEALFYHSDRPPTIGFGQGVEIPVKQKLLGVWAAEGKPPMLIC